MKMITISEDRKTVSFNGKSYPASCIVRTNTSEPWCRRGLHLPNQVHYSSNQDGSNGKPVMPAVFPTGTWEVIDVINNDLADHPDLGPMVIRTNAHQTLKVWALDAKGGYDHETGETIKDWLYEIHFDGYKPDGGFSVGCEHMTEEADMIELATLVRQALVNEKILVIAA